MSAHGAIGIPDAKTARGAPAVVVTLPANLVRLFPGAVRQVELPVSGVGEMIDALDARWPGMRDRLCDSRPAIRRHINVFVDGRRATLETPLAPGAEVTVLTAISGG
jgi:sulfur-carrier protein